MSWRESHPASPSARAFCPRSDQRTDKNARLIPQVAEIDDATWALAGGAGTSVGTGGMVTKIQAAQLATRSGVTTIIAGGTEPDVLARIASGESVGTRFLPEIGSTHRQKCASDPAGGRN